MIEKLDMDSQDGRKSHQGIFVLKHISVADRKMLWSLWILRETETTLGEKPVVREMLRELSSEPLI